MSDWIIHEGKKYFEESYLIGANKTAERRGNRIATLESELREARETEALASKYNATYIAALRKIIKGYTSKSRARKLAAEALHGDGCIAYDGMISTIKKLRGELQETCEQLKIVRSNYNKDHEYWGDLTKELKRKLADAGQARPQGWRKRR